jgi:hypothetical protein
MAAQAIQRGAALSRLHFWLTLNANASPLTSEYRPAPLLSDQALNMADVESADDGDPSITCPQKEFAAAKVCIHVQKRPFSPGYILS